MNLKDLRKKFSSDVVWRGEKYYGRKKVRTVQRDQASIIAKVVGSQSYRVVVSEHQDHHLLATCDCPFYAQHRRFCKHIWAVFRVIHEPPGAPQWLRECNRLIGQFDLGRRTPPLRVTLPRQAPSRQAPSRQAPSRQPGRRPEVAMSRPGPAIPAWRAHLTRVHSALEITRAKENAQHSQQDAILYVLETNESFRPDKLSFRFFVRHPRHAEGLEGLRHFQFSSSGLESLPLEDQHIAALMLAGLPPWLLAAGYQDLHDHLTISPQMARTVVPLLCKSGRFYLRDKTTNLIHGPLGWDGEVPYTFALGVSQTESLDVRESPAGLDVRGALYRGDSREPLTEVPRMWVPGMIFFSDRVAPLEDPGAEEWLPLLQEQAGLRVPGRDIDKFLATIYSLRKLPTIQLPEEFRIEEVKGPPRFELCISRDAAYWNTRLRGQLRFEYGDLLLEQEDLRDRVLCTATRRLFVRDREAEQSGQTRLLGLGIKQVGSSLSDESHWEISQSRFSEAVRQLVLEGFRVRAEGKLYRRSSSFHLEVKSGLDWFDLHATVQFEDQEVPIATLLQALTRKDSFVVLGDGSLGMLPEEWLRRYALFTGMAEPVDGHLRFHKAQVGLLDLLLDEQPEVRVDETFQRAREEIRSFDGILPLKPARGFRGTLRPYQQDGLGWLVFLRRFGLGGCLADDMGLGKTVQVLALLSLLRSKRRTRDSEARRPSLVVAPKSVVFNWLQEAERFSPQLKVCQLNGHDRATVFESFREVDLIVTTYGILRRDITELKDLHFDTVILDEAQTIKNAHTASAKAVRLIKADHRLALSGTPIENHLGELWSLFEFLNPGMLGRAAVFQAASRSSKDMNAESVKMLAKALRPFIMRRTKAQVASDLPPKHEQVLFCELSGVQRRLYDELRAQYRRSLLPELSETGIKKNSIQILEALLRLRQAAIHPGLIDPKKAGQPSAKLDLLLEQLEEVLEEGHKVLVFSQFVSMLSIVKEKLQQKNITYAYLDGQTQDREACVERFQTDAQCPIFLISLKAGGLGLNLTAVDYVFLLDPWWNPAVEAQAVDRAHRIGQTRPVFTYRLLAKDTVEEKILTLQQSKKKLVESILCADTSLIRNLTREDLEVLLS